jgi:hypothetical protein
MVMSRDHNAGRSQSIKTDNGSFAGVEQFRYLGTIITNQNYSGRNQVQIAVRECLQSFGAEYFVFPLLPKN